ncbi:Cellular retinaldehyde binding/alpha-tocopherol transport,CRAL/TRIO, N-terminal domain,CRAL-TRIO lipid [Cinara cedri]|uniref:Cellular retinaldehyde binding/alpha-tocopherol transport,CRAL/TRIO, N-terminal domain,CRAL-TRIO lipid n=1 Tax=Cinara cedri TaxID=506608 RepID=A0A5E4N4V4_9HEMI|nr:Cellular retinaldehyde binding/alpha-tocopherol transport,CRAL/TRIO, N-terminal domain,CRAL-TRIO lipid [Cinara cedri]
MIIDTQLDVAQREFVTKLDYYLPDDQIDENVTMLVEWISKQPHLPKITDRKWLKHFIIGCKYDLHRAKQTIDKYFVARAEHPEFICTFDWEWILFNTKNGTICLFPKMTPEAYRVMCIRMKPMEKDMKVDFKLFFQLFLAILDLQMNIEPMHGEIFLFDLENLPIGQFMNLPPTMTKNCIDLCFNSFPVSVKGIHYINPPAFIGQLLTFVKMLLPNKIKTRVYVHQTLESLYQFIPKDVLPDKYGGTAGDIEKFEDKWFDYGKANTGWLENRQKADLSKRINRPNFGELGVEGTFKKLEID